MLNQGSLRPVVKAVLQTFANLELQLDYEADMPSIRVSAELYCQWFDDVYHPTVDAWMVHFSKEELDSFAAFADVLIRHSDAIDSRTILEIAKTPEWIEVMKSAQNAIRQMESSKTVE